MAKSLDIYGDVVRSIEVSVGGAWVLHTVIATTLGFVAAWSTPQSYYEQSRIPISPWVLLLVLMVTIDETLQAFNPLREFSFLDMSINITCVVTGAILYRLLRFSKVSMLAS